MENNENSWLDEYIDTPDKWFLYGTDKQTIYNFMQNLRDTRIISLQIFQKYIKISTKISILSISVLNVLIDCLLSNNCKLISGFDNLIEVQTIFHTEYESFFKELSTNKPLAIDLLNNIVPPNMLKIIHEAILSGKEDLYTNIKDSLTYIENHYIKRILSDDTHITTKYKERYEAEIIELKEEHKQNKINLAKYKRSSSEILLSYRENVFQEKIKLLKNSFEIVRSDLETFLESNFKYYIEEIMPIFEKDYLEVKERLSLDEYNSNKNKTYENLFDYLSNYQSNYTLHENGLTYYIFIYDILLYKYKMITVFYALSANKINTKDLERLIYTELLDTIQDRKKYYSFFKNITDISQINGYIYTQLSNNDETNPLRFILNYKNESKPKLNHVNIFPMFSTNLEKSTQAISFNLFNNPSYHN